MQQILELNNFEVQVSLGCSDIEQSIVQAVLFSIKIEFVELCKGYQSDQLIDAIDYVKLTEIINQISHSKSFNLIEHLNHEVHQALIQYFTKNKFKIILESLAVKVKPPVFNLHGGVKSTCRSQN